MRTRSNATAVVTVLGCDGLAYEAALNSLPSAQGWTQQSSGSAEANYALTGGALLQGDTAPAEQTQFYRSAGVAFDFTTQTVVAEARVRINQSELIPPGTSPAPRAGWGLQLIDSAGRLVTLFVGGSGYFLLGQNDQASALMSLDATAAFHTFRLVANSAGASVSVDGVPQAKSVDEKYDLRIKRWLTISVIIMLIPAGYFAYILYQEKSYTQRADNFIQEEFIKKGETLIYKKIRYHTIPQKIEIAILSRKYSRAEIEILQGK